MDKKLAAKLAKAKKAWTGARGRAETDKQFDEIEDGRYLARLVGAEIGESKTSGRVQIAWSWKIAEGDYKGQTKMSFDGMETEENLVYVAKNIRRFGYEPPDNIEDIEALLKEILKEKPLARVRLKTRGDFQNVYIDQVFDKADEDEALAEAASEESEEEGAEEETAEEEGGEAEAETEEGEAEAEAEEEGGEAEAEAEEESTEEEATEDEGVELTVGTEVLAPYQGKKHAGTVIEILDAEDKARVKLAGDKSVKPGTVIRVAIDSLEPPEEEADAEEDVPEAPPAPAKKPVAKPAAKPVAKPAAKPAPKKIGKK